MLTANLSCALLDYWTARAEGIPAADLEIRQVPRTDNRICVRIVHSRTGGMPPALEVLAYSTNWTQGGPLLDQRGATLSWLEGKRYASLPLMHRGFTGDTVLQAVCRAVVHQAYGDSVEDRPCVE